MKGRVEFQIFGVVTIFCLISIWGQTFLSNSKENVYFVELSHDTIDDYDYDYDLNMMELSPLERFKATPQQWRTWLFSEDNQKTVTGAKGLRPDISQSGCGLSMKVRFNNSTKLKAFFKHNEEVESYQYDILGESHLREIKASYLDAILGTNVVLPCVGYHIQPFQVLKEESSKRVVAENSYCSFNNRKVDYDDRVVGGSLMMWTEGIQQVPKQKIVHEAMHKNNEYAMKYALFQFLAACPKTDHNHFGISLSNEPPDEEFPRDMFYASLDNDRCLAPRSIILDRTLHRKEKKRFYTWRDVVLGTCTFPSDIRKFIIDTADGVLPKISSVLVKSLKEDELADHLLTLQPESYPEIDERVDLLAKHMRRCRKRS